MTVRSWIRTLFARKPRTIRQAPARWQPSVEALEDRTVPAVSFGPAVAYSVPSGSFPIDVVVGDFNGDGRQDLVTANYLANTNCVLLGNGNGTFQTALTSRTSTNDALAVADLNGDGKLDVVTVTSLLNAVGVSLGNGNGTLARSSFPPSLASQSVAVGDFNGDGKPDVATATSFGATVLLGNGNATFSDYVSYDVGSVARYVAVGDFNGDGRQDLVTANGESNTVSVLLGNGNGTFQTAVPYGTNGSSPYEVAVADLNRDGRPDLVTANRVSHTVSVLLGNGNGTFQTAISYGTDIGYGVAVGDLNNDGAPDLVSSRAAGTQVSVLLNNGSGSFSPGGSFNVGGSPFAVAIGDFNRDGKADLAVAAGSYDTVNVVLNTTVLNIASNQAAVTGNEGSLITNTGTLDDPNGRATVTLTASLGTVTKNNTTGVWTWSYTPPDNTSGPIPVTITATDTAGQTASTSFSLTVNNVAPTITPFTVPATGFEASSVALSAVATDPAGVNDPLSYTWTITRPDGTTLATRNGASASFFPPDNGNYEVSLTITDGDGGSATRSATVNVANRVPTPTLLRTNGVSFALATQVLNFQIFTSDPSSVDTAAGFQHSINWGDSPATQSVPRTVGIVNLTHVYANAGAYTATYTATDKDGGVSVTRTFVTTAWPVTSDSMQEVIDEQGSLTFQVTTNTQYLAVIAAVNGLVAQSTPVTITMNLSSGTYPGAVTSPKAGITLKIVGPGTIVGASPSLNVSGGGSVIVTDVALVNSTNAPTVMVSGGNLILRNVTIEESDVADQAAVTITGGTVDLGTAADPGGNVFNTHGQGQLIHHTGGNGVAAVGNSWKVDGTTLSSPYRIKDEIFDALNAGGGGLVTYVPGSAFISVNGGSLQRGIDAIASEGTVNVEAASNQNYEVGSKLLTVRFENGPTLTQQRNPEDPGLRDLVVTGTAAADNIQLTPAGGGVQAQVRGVPNGRFAPTGRLVVHGGAGDDFISVAGGIALPAWLYGDGGNDALHGGGGDNVLLGGTGDDQLYGGQGRDLLIGGLGADLLNGNGGDDLLLAGTTAFDGNQAALAAVMAEWTSARSYADRVANLRGTGSGPRANGDVFLTVSGPTVTVFDDGAADHLQGASRTDWFFANLSGGVTDVLNGLGDSELVEELGVLAP